MEPTSSTSAPAAATPAPQAAPAGRPDCPGCQAQQARVQELLTRLEQLEARLSQNSTNSSRPPSANAPSTPKPPPKKPRSGRKPGGQPGHRGRTRALKPFEALADVVEATPTHCGHCQRALPQGPGEHDPSPRRHQVTEVPPLVCTTVEYRLHARTCPDCRQRTWASLPEGVSPLCLGPRFQALCALLTGRYHLSRRATREFVREVLGEEVSLGTLSALETRTAAALFAPYQQVAQAVAAAESVHVDETRWRHGNRLAWLWLAATPALSLFRIDPSRSRAAFEALLPPQGPAGGRTVCSDRYSAYTHLTGDAWEICWAHLARDFQGWVDAGRGALPFGQRARASTRRVFRWWHQFGAGKFDRQTLEQRLEPVKEELRATLQEAAVSGHWKVEGTARHLLKHWESLFTFARRAGVEPTNNHAERLLRPGVLWRKRSFGHQSEAGGGFVERLLTVVGSLRLQGRGVLAYLEAAVRAAQTGGAAPSLLPVALG